MSAGTPAVRLRQAALVASLAVGYLSTVVAANWAVTRYGVVPVGFGLLAPAGVYVVGVAFTLRDHPLTPRADHPRLKETP